MQFCGIRGPEQYQFSSKLTFRNRIEWPFKFRFSFSRLNFNEDVHMKCPKEIVRTCGAGPPDLGKRRVKLSKRWVPGLLCIAGIAIAFQERGHNALPVTSEKAQIRDLVHLVSGTG